MFSAVFHKVFKNKAKVNKNEEKQRKREKTRENITFTGFERFDFFLQM